MIRLELHEYDGRWPLRFREHRERLAAALKIQPEKIHHIGSTSVPGLAAKPIIDIEVEDVTAGQADAHTALESAGYHLAIDERGHRLYKPADGSTHVHLWSNAQDIERHLLFRDHLRRNAEDRALYEHVKRVLIARAWPDSNDYADAKDGVINIIMRRARGHQTGPRVERFAAVLLQHVPANARVLEIGAGEGFLAQRLTDAGHEVVAIDRHLASTYPIIETTFEAYQAPAQSFDCVCTQYVLHHIGDLEEALVKVEGLLKPGGFLAIDDYGWERSDDPEFRADRCDLHSSAVMLSALRARFEQMAYFDHAYLQDGAGDDSIAFTFIGRRR